MAKVRSNIIVDGIGGMLGNQLVFKQDKAGRTIVSVKPTFDENRTFSDAQQAQQEAFREAARRDERTLALARRVTVREDAALTAKLPGLRPARVAVTLKDGRVLGAEALTNRGDTEDPYSDEEVVAKYREMLGILASSKRKKLF